MGTIDYPRRDTVEDVMYKELQAEVDRLEDEVETLKVALANEEEDSRHWESMAMEYKDRLEQILAG